MTTITSKFLLLVRTIRFLKPVQITARLKNAVYKPAVRPLAGMVKRFPVNHVAMLPKTESIELLGGSQPPIFTFLGASKSWSNSIDWEDLSTDRLWRYNLHYFDFLNCPILLKQTGSTNDAGVVLIDDWINNNTPGVGTGWEPYPLSLRIVNWVKWSYAGGRLTPPMHDSLATQAGRLEQTLEYHILANHLFANAKAMVFAGSYFEGGLADKWLQVGLRLVERGLCEQVLDDGGHYERSPMYHHIILEDVLDLIGLAKTHDSLQGQLIDAATLKRWETIALRMLEWAETMSHPDGNIAFFNDAALHIAPTADRLAAYASALGLQEPARQVESKYFADSGYVRMCKSTATVLMNVAQTAPDYQPGHTHADSLSLEFSLSDGRVLVNSGTSTYNVDELRAFQRSTAAHNTVIVDDKNSSEVWSGFRVARRARVHDTLVTFNEETDYVSANHDGYCINGNVVHHREVSLSQSQLSVLDKIHGNYESAVAHFFIHPDITVIEGDQCLVTANGTKVTWQVDGGHATVDSSMWYPEFGKSVKNHCLRVTFNSPECRVSFNY